MGGRTTRCSFDAVILYYRNFRDYKLDRWRQISNCRLFFISKCLKEPTGALVTDRASSRPRAAWYECFCGAISSAP